MTAPILFDRYVFQKGQTIPEKLELRGAIACTRDTKHQGILHLIFFIAQKIHNFLFGRKDDVSMSHWMIMLGRNPSQPFTHPVAHAVYPSIKVDYRAYLDPASENSSDVTELILYIPRDPILRKNIATYAEQSAVDEDHIGFGKKSEKKTSFSIGDIVRGFFHRPIIRPNKRIMRRSALAMADLLRGSSIKDRKKARRALFCNPYSSFVVQSSLLIMSLKTSEIENLKTENRLEMARKFYKRIKHLDSSDPLSVTYWKNPICQINSRYAFSSFTSTIMNWQSELGSC